MTNPCHPDYHRQLAWWHVRMAVYHLRKFIRPKSNHLEMPRRPDVVD
jgi:hypothetical protein